jgi:hypothetical protein
VAWCPQENKRSCLHRINEICIRDLCVSSLLFIDRDVGLFILRGSHCQFRIYIVDSLDVDPQQFFECMRETGEEAIVSKNQTIVIRYGLAEKTVYLE